MKPFSNLHLLSANQQINKHKQSPNLSQTSPIPDKKNIKEGLYYLAHRIEEDGGGAVQQLAVGRCDRGVEEGPSQRRTKGKSFISATFENEYIE